MSVTRALRSLDKRGLHGRFPSPHHLDHRPKPPSSGRDDPASDDVLVLLYPALDRLSGEFPTRLSLVEHLDLSVAGIIHIETSNEPRFDYCGVAHGPQRLKEFEHPIKRRRTRKRVVWGPATRNASHGIRPKGNRGIQQRLHSGNRGCGTNRKQNSQIRSQIWKCPTAGSCPLGVHVFQVRTEWSSIISDLDLVASWASAQLMILAIIDVVIDGRGNQQTVRTFDSLPIW
jgi:hypothetical protein